MMVFPIRVKLTNVMAVQGSHDTDASKHRWAAGRRHQNERVRCGLPLRSLMLGFWKLGDIIASALQRDELMAAR